MHIICVYMYVYMYMYMYLYIHTCTCIYMCICLYIYIYVEREREITYYIYSLRLSRGSVACLPSPTPAKDGVRPTLRIGHGFSAVSRGVCSGIGDGFSAVMCADTARF